MSEKRRTKRDIAVDALLKAAGAYVDASGGKALVAGGIQILRWPGESDYKFSVVVPITGRAPEFEVRAASQRNKGEKP